MPYHIWWTLLHFLSLLRCCRYHSHIQHSAFTSYAQQNTTLRYSPKKFNQTNVWFDLLMSFYIDSTLPKCWDAFKFDIYLSLSHIHYEYLRTIMCLCISYQQKSFLFSLSSVFRNKLYLVRRFRWVLLTALLLSFIL